MTPSRSARARLMAAISGMALAGSAAASDVEGVRAKFLEMDTNGDRSLQFSEIRAARATIFDRLDANRNGVLDADEIATVRKIAEARGNKGGLLAGIDFADRAVEIDIDRDGKITRVEFVAYLPERLKAADKDGNQTLSLGELRSLKRDAGVTQ
jgi:hypothetical protein